MKIDPKIKKMRKTFYKHADYPNCLFRSKKELDAFLARKEKQNLR